MIVEDEYEADNCDNAYLFDDGDTFTVDPVERTDLTDSRLFSNHLSTIRSHYMSNKTHFSCVAVKGPLYNNSSWLKPAH
jgi:hypothetical protein